MASLADFDERRLEDMTEPHIYLEAATCAEHGCVRFEEFTLQRARAKVDADVGYETELWAVADGIGWSCTCDQWTEEKPCLHIAATAITTWRELPVDAGGRTDVSKGETEEMADRNPSDVSGLDPAQVTSGDPADPDAVDEEER